MHLVTACQQSLGTLMVVFIVHSISPIVLGKTILPYKLLVPNTSWLGAYSTVNDA